MSSLQIGRLMLGPPFQWQEQFGDPVTSIGGAIIPQPRAALRHAVDIGTLAADGTTDTLAARLAIRRQLRSLLNNTPLKLQGGYYVLYSDDLENSGWYVPDQGQIIDGEGAMGLATGWWKLANLVWFMAGHRRTAREGYSIWMKDLRTGLFQRDSLGWIYSTDFSALPTLQLTVVPNGATQITNTILNQVAPGTALPTGRDGGTTQQLSGLADLAVIAYERPESALNLSDVIAYDRRGITAPVEPKRLTHTSAGSANNSTVTTTAIDTTGASAIVVALSVSGGGSLSFAGGLTDSAGNTWTQLPQQSSGNGQPSIVFYYKLNPTTSANHTFTYTGGTQYYPSLAVAAYSGVDTLDVTNGAAGAGINSIQTGSITPTKSYELLVSAATFYNAGSQPFISLDSGFSVFETVAIAGGAHWNLQLADIQGAGGAPVNPTWTFGGFTGNEAAVVLALKSSSASAIANWEEIYGPDYPFNWMAVGQPNDMPVLDNGLVRVRYSGTPLPGFSVDVWNGNAYVEQGKMIVRRIGDTINFCDTWVSASVMEYSPNRTVISCVLRSSIDTFSRERVILTLCRGELGVTFECYPALKSNGTQADVRLEWNVALNAGASDLNNSLFGINSQGSGSWTPGAAGTGVAIATAGTGAGTGNSGLFPNSLTNFLTNFASAENWITLLRCPTAFNAIGPYQTTLVVVGGAKVVPQWAGSQNLAYGGLLTNTYHIVSTNSAGYVQAQVYFASTVADQILEAESATLGTGTTAAADGGASGTGNNSTSTTRTTDANPHITRATWPNGFLGTYRVFVRVRTTASTLNVYAKTGATTGVTQTTTSTSYVWLDLGEITANNTTFEIHLWATAAATCWLDRIEACLVQDRARTSFIYSGSRDFAQAALTDSRASGCLVAR